MGRCRPLVGCFCVHGGVFQSDVYGPAVSGSSWPFPPDSAVMEEYLGLLGWHLGVIDRGGRVLGLLVALAGKVRAAAGEAAAGRWRRSLVHGIVIAATFVGTLFGGFWVATAVWRSYFFDPRIVRLLVVAIGLTVMSGCASTITYGEVRRRELFHAMLVAWVLGLALMWRWWSRPRPGNPPMASG